METRPSTRSLLNLAASRLGSAGVPSPDHDSRVLLQHIVGSQRPLVLIDHVSPADADAYLALIARREMREPLQLILGEVTFRYSLLYVSAGVFIPRPETETVAGIAIDVARTHGGSIRIVDLCTGSGAIAAAFADEVPQAEVWAVELSDTAFETARRNLDPRGVTVVHADAATALRELDGTVDIVVSNPPYIPDGAVPRDPEVREWDPPMALFGGGPDGESVPHAVVLRAAGLLRAGGLFIMEHGDIQGRAMRGLVASTGAFDCIETGKDMTGRDRFVRAVRRSSGESARLAP